MEPISTNTSTLTKNKPLYNTISLNRAKKLGNELSEFLKTNGLIVNIAGRNYVPVEGWQFTGVQLGLTQIVTSCEPVAPFEDTKEVKYKSTVEIINQQGTVVSRGYAWCSNKESKKKSFDEYAIASMAQTRAVGKAYRNILSWIVKMAGYESTPAEEINQEAVEDDLSKIKTDVFARFKEVGITESEQMLAIIKEATGKQTIDNSDDARAVINKLSKED